ncbi:Protein W01A8.8 [Aphelenchoides avenae]|nr:Protein W01A8.8 [Aphelenchus avenae]
MPVGDKCEQPCDGCNAYKCIEDKERCGPKGYPLAFGLKYCNRFFEPDVYNRYDKPGQAFIRCTKDCLIGVLQNWTTKCSNIPCDVLEGAAFTSHVDCYLSCGFCDICANNKAALWHTYDLKDFISKHAWDQVVAVAKACGVTYGHVAYGAKKRGDTIVYSGGTISRPRI